ncbi:MAG: A24 family peptidase [Candidatus Eisenbacteria bacterium]|uniref:Prepilin leader peptidase/N-methyltransferase n=1 Tax=Eiseniibacteriota bacterium TaxID=2212470 RepID=A0A948RUW4_UNCEI|nr:A24 family peptidase [Candidatus Eisenbacteria bacterium]MBU1948014.1 A24 family peptidase [Candidatus Eisenbacteria bacterium]MBU2691445.1 A24 family peptidase [Candidatus Eisenbacteria bacterium]
MWFHAGWGQVVVIIVGLVLGSFLNVVRVRLPEGGSILFPSSHCPRCKAKVRPWDNIPVLSYLLLGGRCRDCRLVISWCYPVVELLSAVVLWFTVRNAPTPMAAAFSAVFALALLLVLFIDLDWQIIPDVITLPGIVLGLLAGFWMEGGVLPRLIGAAVGGLGLLTLAWLYRAATGTDGLGMGDVKLLAMVGAFLGWKGTLGVILLGSLAGSLLGLALLVAGRADRKTTLPFGSFLAPAAWVVLYWGQNLWEVYRGLCRALGG